MDNEKTTKCESYFRQIINTAILAGIISNQPPTTLDNSINMDETDYVEPDELNNEQTQGSQSGQQAEQNNNDMTTKHLFALNEITGTHNAAPLYRDPDLHYNEVWDFNKAADYLGVNIPEAVNAISGGNTLDYTVLMLL